VQNFAFKRLIHMYQVSCLARWLCAGSNSIGRAKTPSTSHGRNQIGCDSRFNCARFQTTLLLLHHV